MKPKLTYLSFGAGVQSTALLIMSNLGLLDCPRADVAIFADTGDEPSWVYETVERMRAWSKIPIAVTSKGHLSADLLSANGKRFVTMPVFVKSPEGDTQMLRRQCTREYKLEPIEKYVRQFVGLKKGERAAGRFHADALIGISLDEATRMKPSRTKWITNRYPLVDAGMRRGDCRRLVVEYGFPEPQRSACVYCPYKSDEKWREMKAKHPVEFEKAATFDDAIRTAVNFKTLRGTPYIHRSLQPLRVIDFDRQGRLFGDMEDEECEGGCFL